MITINDLVHKHKLKNKTTSIMKIFEVLSSLPLSDVGIYLRDGPFPNDIRIVNLHPSKGTDYVNNIVYCGFATNYLAGSLRSHHHPVSSKSDNIPAALLSSLCSLSRSAYIIARLRLAAFRFARCYSSVNKHF